MQFTSRFCKKKEDDCYFEPEKMFCSYVEREKSGSLLFGAPKCISEPFGAGKKKMTAISNKKNCFAVIRDRKKWIPVT